MACCYNICSTVSAILSLFQGKWQTVTFRNPSHLTMIFKSQDACTFQFMCKHTELKHAIYPTLWVLERFKTAKVTFSLTEGHWQSCYWIGHNDFLTAPKPWPLDPPVGDNTIKMFIAYEMTQYYAVLSFCDHSRSCIISRTILINEQTLCNVISPFICQQLSQFSSDDPLHAENNRPCSCRK